MLRWLQKWWYNRLLDRVMEGLTRLRLEDLEQVSGYADGLYSDKKYRQERAAQDK
jgi:hypothetical protein